MEKTIKGPNLFQRTFNKLKKKTPGELITFSIVWIIFMAVALSYIYILVWCFLSGLRTNEDIVLAPFELPKAPRWRNFIDVFNLLSVKGTSFFGMLLNSIYFSVGGALISQFCVALFAHVTVNYKFPGAKIYPAVTFVSLILPIYGAGGSLYKVFFDLGLVNSYAFILTAVGSMNMYYLYYRTFYMSLSKTYSEAAEIDGANDYQIFWHVMLPLSSSLFWAEFILTWLAQWNDMGTSLLYLNELPQLSVGLYLFEKDMVYSSRNDILYVGCFLVSIPPLLLFTFCNGILTSNLSLGGIKE